MPVLTRLQHGKRWHSYSSFSRHVTWEEQMSAILSLRVRRHHRNRNAPSEVEAVQERPQFRRGLELRDGVEFLERRGEGVRQAPHRSRLEFLQRRIEIPIVDDSGQVFWHLQLAFDECLVDDQLRCYVRDLASLPQ